jgi:hypothetical protein
MRYLLDSNRWKPRYPPASVRDHYSKKPLKITRPKGEGIGAEFR